MVRSMGTFSLLGTCSYSKRWRVIWRRFSKTQGIREPPELEPLVSICNIPDRSHLLTVRQDTLGSIVRGASLLNPSSLLGGLAGMAMPRRVEAFFDARMVIDLFSPAVLQYQC